MEQLTTDKSAICAETTLHGNGATTSVEGQENWCEFENAYRTFSEVVIDAKDHKVDEYSLLALVLDAYQNGTLFVLATNAKGICTIGSREQANIDKRKHFARLSGMLVTHLLSTKSDMSKYFEAIDFATTMSSKDYLELRKLIEEGREVSDEK